MTREDNTVITKPHGLSIGAISLIVLSAAIVLCTLLILDTFNVTLRFDENSEAADDYMVCVDAKDQAKAASDYLTEQTRLYVETGDITYIKNYFNEADNLQNREQALEKLMSISDDQAALGNFRKSLQASYELMESEKYAFYLTLDGLGYDDPAKEVPQLAGIKLKNKDIGLTDKEKIEKGRSLLFDENYLMSKSEIYSGVEDAANILLNSTSEIRQNSQKALESAITQQRAMIVALLALVALTFAMIYFLVIHPLRAHAARLKKDEPLEVVGAYEFKYLANTYNRIYDQKREIGRNLQHLSEHDQLTGIANRRSFDNQTAVLSDDSSKGGLLIVDVDDFKMVNDTYGHDVGDRILKSVADQLVAQFRSTDLVARIGGDEFVVLFANLTPQMLDLLRSKVTAISEQLKNPEDDLPVITLSCGCTFFSTGYNTDVYRRADTALYRVKEAGRDGFDYEPEA